MFIEPVRTKLSAFLDQRKLKALYLNKFKMKIFRYLYHWTKSIENYRAHAYGGYFKPTHSNELFAQKIELLLSNIEDELLSEMISDKYKIITQATTKSGKSIDYEKDVDPIQNKISRRVGYFLPGSDSSRQSIAFSLVSGQEEDNFVSELLKIQQLYVLYHNNPYDVSWDNRELPSGYKYRRGLKTYFDKNWQETRVDLSDRPGRYADLGQFRFEGAHEFWFGPAAFDFFPKQHLLDYPYGHLIEELDNDIVHIRLFEIEDYWKPVYRDILAHFRKYLRVDKLAANNKNNSNF